MVNIITNAPAIDYVTLGAFSIEAHKALQWAFDSSARGTGKVARRMQYEGQQYEGLYLGNAVIEGQAHKMLISSAIQSEYVVAALERSDIRSSEIGCSRIDLQLTIERDISDKFLSGYRNEIKAALATSTRGRMPKVRTIDNDSSLGETIYIGSRVSEKMVRIYDKPIAGDNFIRFEVEWKGDAARKIWKTIYNREATRATIIHGELLRYAGIPLFDRFIECVSGDEPQTIMLRRERTDDESRFRWLTDVVMPVVRKMYLSGSHKKELRSMLVEVLETIDRIDSDGIY